MTKDERAVIDAAKAWHTSRKGCDLGMVSSALYNAVDAMLANKGKPEPVTVEEYGALLRAVTPGAFGGWKIDECGSRYYVTYEDAPVRRDILALLARLAPALEPCGKCGSTCTIRGGTLHYVMCTGHAETRGTKASGYCGYSGPCWETEADAVKYHNAAQRAIRAEREDPSVK